MKVKESKHIKSNGRCYFCNTRLKIDEMGHIILKTRYTKYFKEKNEVEVKCPKCKSIQLVNLI